MKKGYIYVITNKQNGKQYVGQTSRDIQTRFLEHCSEKRGQKGSLHDAIQKEGYLNFSIKSIEEVELDKLDEREKYWIKTLNTQETGYNIMPGGSEYIRTNWKKVQVVENNLIFDSCQEMARLFSSITSWSLTFLTDKFRSIINTDKEFLGYHFKELPINYEASAETDLENWIKTLAIRFQGQHIYCFELDKEFETVGEAAKYLLDNNLYETQSKTPIQSLITSIGYNINKKTEFIKGKTQNYTFIKMPGTTKQSGGNFQGTKIYCPQLDKTFNTQIEAANYFIDNKIWTGIKLKTAKLRISDIIRGVFPDYKGYTFIKVE